MSQSPPEGLLERVRAEYLEMPGLRLSIDQLQRLCGVEPTLCQLVLDVLVDAKFLCLKSDGAYERLTEGEAHRPREAKADQKAHGSAPRQTSRVLFDNHPRTKPSQRV